MPRRLAFARSSSRKIASPSAVFAAHISSKIWRSRQEVSSSCSQASPVILAVLAFRHCFFRTEKENNTRSMNNSCFAAVTVSTACHQGFEDLPVEPINHLWFLMVSTEKADRAAVTKELTPLKYKQHAMFQDDVVPEFAQVFICKWRDIICWVPAETPKITACIACADTEQND